MLTINPIQIGNNQNIHKNRSYMSFGARGSGLVKEVLPNTRKSLKADIFTLNSYERELEALNRQLEALSIKRQQLISEIPIIKPQRKKKAEIQNSKSKRKILKKAGATPLPPQTKSSQFDIIQQNIRFSIKKIEQLKMFLHFNRIKKEEVASLKDITHIPQSVQIETTKLKNMVEALVKRNNAIEKFAYKTEGSSENAQSVKIDYDALLAEHVNKKPVQKKPAGWQNGNTPINNSVKLQRKLWTEKKQSLKNGKLLAEEYFNNESRILELKQKLSDKQSVDYTTPFVQAQMKVLNHQEAKLKKFRTSQIDESGISGKQYLQAKIKEFKRKQATLIKSEKNLTSLERRIENYTEIKTDLESQILETKQKIKAEEKRIKNLPENERKRIENDKKISELRLKYNECLLKINGGHPENFNMDWLKTLRNDSAKLYELSNGQSPKKKSLIGEIIQKHYRRNTAPPEVKGLIDRINELEEKIGRSRGAKKKARQEELRELISESEELSLRAESIMAEIKSLSRESIALKPRTNEEFFKAAAY